MKVRIHSKRVVGLADTVIDDVLQVELEVGGERIRLTPSGMLRPDGALIDVVAWNDAMMILPRGANAFTICQGKV